MLKKKIMAFILSGIMVLSGVIPVDAAELNGNDMLSENTEQVMENGKVRFTEKAIEDAIPFESDAEGYYNSSDLETVTDIYIRAETSSEEVIDLAELAYLPGIQRLFIEGNAGQQIIGYEVLAELNDVFDLSLEKCGIDDTLLSEILACVPNLTKIMMHDNNITTADPLAHMEKLEKVYLDEPYLTDISALITASIPTTIGGKAQELQEELVKSIFELLSYEPVDILCGNYNYYHIPEYIADTNINVSQIAYTITDSIQFESADPSIARYDPETGKILGIKPGTTTMNLSYAGSVNSFEVTVHSMIDPLPEEEFMDPNEIPDHFSDSMFLAGGSLFQWGENGNVELDMGNDIVNYVSSSIYFGSGKNDPVKDGVITLNSKGQVSLFEYVTYPEFQIVDHGVLFENVKEISTDVFGNSKTMILTGDGVLTTAKFNYNQDDQIYLDINNKFENVKDIIAPGVFETNDGMIYYLYQNTYRDFQYIYYNGVKYKFQQGTLTNTLTNTVIEEGIETITSTGYLKGGKYYDLEGKLIADHVVSVGNYINYESYYLDTEGNMFLLGDSTNNIPVLVCTSVLKVSDKYVIRKNGSVGKIKDFLYKEKDCFKYAKYMEPEKNIIVEVPELTTATPKIDLLTADTKEKMERLLTEWDVAALDGTEILFNSYGKNVDPDRVFTVTFPILEDYADQDLEVYYMRSDQKLEKVNLTKDGKEASFTTSEPGNYAFVYGKPVSKTGKWVVEGKTWKYRNADGSFVKNNWKKIDGYTYYFDQNGGMVKGWKAVGKIWYYFDGSGHMKTGWLKEGNNWFYLQSSGAMTKGWTAVNKTWYYFDGSGHMKTGWLKEGNNWFYLQPSGAMAKGWTAVNKTWYYFDGSGHMKTGWLKEGNNWFYLQPSGAMAKGWTAVNKTWYYFDGSGHMKTGWLKEGNNWFYLQSSGAMAKGWQAVGKTWYYFDGSGHMKTGWLNLDGKWYYTDPSGAMLKGWQNIGGKKYYFNGSGVWIPDMKEKQS